MTQPGPEPSGRTERLLDRVLGYMSTPWRATVIVLVLVIGAVFWATWSERDRLFEMLRPRPSVLATIDLVAAPTELSALIKDTSIDLAAIWSVDLHANGAFFEVGRLGEAKWTMQPRRVPFITDTSNPSTFVQLFAGHVVCSAIGDQTQPVMRRLSMQSIAAEGMRRVCLVAIPPTVDTLLGVLIIAWREPATPESEAASIGAAVSFARRIVKWS